MIDSAAAWPSHGLNQGGVNGSGEAEQQVGSAGGESSLPWDVPIRACAPTVPGIPHTADQWRAGALMRQGVLVDQRDLSWYADLGRAGVPMRLCVMVGIAASRVQSTLVYKRSHALVPAGRPARLTPLRAVSCACSGWECCEYLRAEH